MGKRKAITESSNRCKKSDLHDNVIVFCRTTRTNIIVNGCNYTNISGYTRPHVALSYVSSGERYDKNDKDSETANMFTVGYKSREAQTLYSRYSNDRFKYIAAMENVEQNVMIWTDNVSLPVNIPNKRVMSEIGQAYSTAFYTIAVLEEDDAKIISEVVNMLNNTIKHIEFGANLCSSFSDRIDVINAGVRIPVDHAKIVVRKTYGIADRIADFTEKRGQFSYWSRAWTMQEQHQSNVIDYSLIEGGKLRSIVNSSELVVWCTMVIDIMKNVSELIRTYDSNTKVTSVLNNLFAFLTGTERKIVCAKLDEGLMDAESLLIRDIISHPRCAVDARQMNTALCIALGIFVDGDTKRWRRILGRIVSKGFIPLKRRHGIYLQEGWIPEGSNIEIEEESLSQYCSTVFTCFTRFEEVPQIRAFIDYEGKLVIRSYLMQINITRRSQRRTKVGVSYVMKGVTLVDSDNKVVSDVTVEIKDAENTSVKLESTMVYEKTDSDTINILIEKRALLVGGGAFVILNKTRSKIVASIIPSPRAKRQWHDFYNKITQVGEMVFVQLDGIGDDIGYY